MRSRSREARGARWGWRLLAAPAFGLLYLVASGNGAGASLFVAPGPRFPARVTAGQSFSTQVGVGNFSTPPESTATVAQIDLVPACANSAVDCSGSVETGVFTLSATGTAASGPASCRGTWTINGVRDGVYRFVPPGGEASLLLAQGETCVVDFTATANRVPPTDTNPSAGVQTNQVVSVTAQASGAAPVRVANPAETTVAPASRPAVPMADYDGDGKADVVLFRPSEGRWFVRHGAGTEAGAAWGMPGDVPVLGDYDGDGKSDLAVYRTSEDGGVWFIRNSAGGEVAQTWGVPGDIPVPGDYDGDGKTDLAVYRPGGNGSTWFVKGSGGTTLTQMWGDKGDRPVPGDYDGDGRADVAVYRSAVGVWLVRYATGATMSVAWGGADDVAVPADYDGDGKADLAVFRPTPGVWLVSQSTGTLLTLGWGVSGDIPVPADHDGDRKSELSVFRPSQSLWFVRTAGGTTSQTWGESTDVVVGVPPALRT